MINNFYSSKFKFNYYKNHVTMSMNKWENFSRNDHKKIYVKIN